LAADLALAKPEFSICIPCYNEENAVAETIQHIESTVNCDARYEIVAVNDGSTDRTGKFLDRLEEEHERLRVVHHGRNRGYGAALKTAIRHSEADLIVITDADGTYPNERICDLVAECVDQDMVVGSRTAEGVKYSKIRKIPKIFLRRWASWIAGQDIPDINSGLRVFRKETALRFFGILPDTFSFTTTITLATLTTFCRVKYVPITYHHRVGTSKIKPIRDTLRFMALILRTGTYFAPVRTFLPFVFLFLAASLASLAYDVFWIDDLTEKTILLFLATFNSGMFMLLADMIDKRSGH
jgi:glycosyltransferase involved in cell wall biosynthesis